MEDLIVNHSCTDPVSLEFQLIDHASCSQYTALVTIAHNGHNDRGIIYLYCSLNHLSQLQSLYRYIYIHNMLYQGDSIVSRFQQAKITSTCVLLTTTLGQTIPIRDVKLSTEQFNPIFAASSLAFQIYSKLQPSQQSNAQLTRKILTSAISISQYCMIFKNKGLSGALSLI